MAKAPGCEMSLGVKECNLNSYKDSKRVIAYLPPKRANVEMQYIAIAATSLI